MLKTVAVAPNQPQAELLISRLAEIGIGAIAKLALSNPEFGASGARTICVDQRDEARAREFLALEEQPFSDEELARLSEEAGRQARERGESTDRNDG